MAEGCSADESGPICLSHGQKNLVKSNIVGASAYWGKDTMLKNCITQVKKANLNYKALETSDTLGKKSEKYVEELKNFTPDLLAAASPHSNENCLKVLQSTGMFSFQGK